MKKESVFVNNTEILILTENAEKYIAIRSVCKAIGISYQGQIERIKEDIILGSTLKTILMVGADNKKREMQSIEYKYVFGWLLKIDARNIKESSREAVIKYQKECYEVLFEYFTNRLKVLKQKTEYQIEIEKLENEWKNSENYQAIEILKKKQSDATKRLNAMDKAVISEQLDLFRNSN